MSHVRLYKVGDTLTCLDATDSHGLLKRGEKYKVIATDNIRVQLEGVSLTWAVTRFRHNKKAK